MFDYDPAVWNKAVVIAANLFEILAVAGAAALQPAEDERSRPPPGNFADYITSDDYPGGALADGAQGTVGFVVTVSPSGRVTGCAITRSSGYTSLDNGTCRLARRRLRFNPARRRDGKPVEARSREFVIVWRLEGGPDPGDRLVRQRTEGKPVEED